MVILINYADEKYKQVQLLNASTGKRFGHVDQVICYDPSDIDEVFLKCNREILSVKRGNGLWLWKPYFILKTLKNVNEGDIVFYCDSGAFFIRSLKHIIKICEEQDIWVSVLPTIEHQFTTRYVLEQMECCDEVYTDTNQISASFLAFKKCDKSIQFVNEWLKWCCVPGMLEGRVSCNEVKDFIEHREDQSILSLLVKKNNIKYYQDPSQMSKIPEHYLITDNTILNVYSKTDYCVCIIHHRQKNINTKIFIIKYMYGVFPKKISSMVFKRFH